MDSRSRNEAAGGGDWTWLTNLRLLGLESSKLEITGSMFDHPNPTAFQAIFFKLLELLNKEQTNQELRDCWPVLDKKQEAEFRRKVVGILKLYQKDHPEDLPFTNPSLFLSPGGRKFIIFLNKFTTFVVKVLVMRNDMILHKPTVKKGFKLLKKKLLLNLTVKTEDSLKEAVEDQEEIEQIEKKAKTTGSQVISTYDEYKKKLEEFEQSQSQSPTEPEESSIVSLEMFDQRCQFVKNSFEELVEASREIKKSFDIIEYVIDDSVQKPILNLQELPPSYIGSNLTKSYQSLLGSALQSVERVLSQNTVLPNISLDNEDVKQIMASLQAVHEELESINGLAKVGSGKLLAESKKIDWTVHALSKTPFDSREALLPPTPSVVENIRVRQEKEELGVSATIRSLKLFTPEGKLATPSLRLPGGGVGGMLTPLRSGPSAILSRQFHLNKKVATPINANSPQLKPKAAFGEMSRLGQESQLGNMTTRSTGSIGEFTPDLCSTVAGTFSELAESSKLDTTQSKIEMYKKVLDGLKNKSQDRSLLTAWNSHRDSLSPRSERSRMIPRTLMKPTSPQKRDEEEEEEEEDFSLFSAAGNLTSTVSRETSPDMLSRLDQLMVGLTLNDSNDPAFLNVSLEEVDLLSPNLV